MTGKNGVSVGLNLLVLAGLVAWVLLLRPVAVGGPATYVVIHGNSMYPSYREGELVITQRRASYRVGDVVAYRVAEGLVGGGHVVIHRIAAGSAESGFTMKGDHNQYPDPWHPKAAEILGSSWIAVPVVGTVLVIVRQPIVAASIAALFALQVLQARFPLARRKTTMTAS